MGIRSSIESKSFIARTPISQSSHESDRAIAIANQIGLAVKGNREALLELLLGFQRELGIYVSAQLGDKLGAIVSEEDVLQETFVTAYASIGQLRATDESGFRAWLKTMARNRIRDMARYHQAAKRGGAGRNQPSPSSPDFHARAAELIYELSANDTSPSQMLAKREATDAIAIALASLPNDQRQAIRLHCFDNLTLDETAAKMNRTLPAIRGLIQRGKNAIRQSLHHSTLWLSKK